jgi:hypothetical protein
MPKKIRNRQWEKKDFDEKATSPGSVHGVIVPAGFNAQAYLQELMQQLPGFEGKYEIARQLAAAAGRKEPWTHEYLDKIRAGRQPVSEPFRRALFCHSVGQFAPPESLIEKKIT